MSTDRQTNTSSRGHFRFLDHVAIVGCVIYALAAPHTIAGSWIGISVMALAWLVRTIATRRTGLSRSSLDVPLCLFFIWTVLSCVFSEEPQESLPKLVNASTFLMFYLAQALLTRKRAVLMAAVMIVSAVAGVMWGAGELVVGRGVVVTALSENSRLRAETPLREGDVVWRVNEKRVSSAAEIDELIRATPTGGRAQISVISRGEHVEWPGVVVTDELRREHSPSGITGGGRAHRFRASGWTRHYETFAELLQLIGQLALGFALVQWIRIRSANEEAGGSSVRALLAAAAFIILATGIALTAMRSTLVAFAVAMCVVAWRAVKNWRQRVIVIALGLLLLGIGGFAIWRTRATGALSLNDPSAVSRVEVAKVAARRIIQHPILGHGMDAMHRHWHEWGFPGTDMLDAHSTPIQIAFDRGLPALGLWLWLMFAFWRLASRAEINMREGSLSVHGLAFGIMGALTGFLLSSLVNYNFGDSEVSLLLWWMMGAIVVINRKPGERSRA